MNRKFAVALSALALAALAAVAWASGLVRVGSAAVTDVPVFQLAEGTRRFALYWDDKPFGITEYTVTPSTDGFAVQRDSENFMRKPGAPDKATTSSTGTYSRDGLALDCLEFFIDGATIPVLTARRTGSELVVRYEGDDVEERRDLPPGSVAIDTTALMNEGFELLASRIDFLRKGEQTLSIMDPLEAMLPSARALLVTSAKAECRGLRTISLFGERTRALAVDLTLPLMPVRCWYDPGTLRLLRIEYSIGIRADALPDGVIPELIPVDVTAIGTAMARSLMVRTGRDLINTDRLVKTEAAVDLWLIGDKPELNQSGQAFKGEVNGADGIWHVTGQITIGAPDCGPWSEYPTADGTPPLGSASDAAPQYLLPEVRVEADDPAIRAMAEEILYGPGSPPAQTRWQAATRVANWVYANISYEVTFGGAKQTLVGRKGDCAPHAYLTTALLRAAGVPCRSVAGLTLNRNIAGQHVWVEVYLGEKIGWVPIDPTTGEIETMGATHIHAWDGVGMLAPGFGPLKVRVVRAEMKPQ